MNRGTFISPPPPPPPHLTEKRGAHSPLAMTPLPVSLLHPSCARTWTRPSAEHQGKAEAVSPARPSVPTTPFGRRSRRLGSNCCPGWRSVWGAEASVTEGALHLASHSLLPVTHPALQLKLCPAQGRVEETCRTGDPGQEQRTWGWAYRRL